MASSFWRICMSNPKPHLNDIVDFGQEQEKSKSLSTTDANRIKEIVKKLQEINARLDSLASRIL